MQPEQKVILPYWCSVGIYNSLVLSPFQRSLFRFLPQTFPSNPWAPLNSSCWEVFFFPQPFPFGECSLLLGISFWEMFSLPSRVKFNSGDAQKNSDCDELFYIKYTKISGKLLVQLLKKTGIFLPFWEILHSNSSPRIILKQQECFNTWRWKLYSCTCVGVGKVPNWAGRTGARNLPEAGHNLD